MTSASVFQYQGNELDVFARAGNWKAYWASRLVKLIHGDVLEVGAGLGANTTLLYNSSVRSWHCLEPDPQLCRRLAQATAHLPSCSTYAGTTRDISGHHFDCILYIDVLEHIQADGDEIAAAARLLRSGGHLIVLSPACQMLYSKFDASIGHYRRYARRSLRACTPQGCTLEALFYLDSAGALLSLANRLLLRQATPSLRQIQIWDRCVIPVSRVLDAAVRYSFGKTIVGIWKCVR